jgi:hypothetical protein
VLRRLVNTRTCARVNRSRRIKGKVASCPRQWPTGLSCFYGGRQVVSGRTCITVTQYRQPPQQRDKRERTTKQPYFPQKMNKLMSKTNWNEERGQPHSHSPKVLSAARSQDRHSNSQTQRKKKKERTHPTLPCAYEHMQRGAWRSAAQGWKEGAYVSEAAAGRPWPLACDKQPQFAKQSISGLFPRLPSHPLQPHVALPWPCTRRHGARRVQANRLVAACARVETTAAGAAWPRGPARRVAGAGRFRDPVAARRATLPGCCWSGRSG